MIAKTGSRQLEIMSYRSVVTFVKPSHGLLAGHHGSSQDSVRTMKDAKRQSECPSILMKCFRAYILSVLTVDSTIADVIWRGLPASKIASQDAPTEHCSL